MNACRLQVLLIFGVILLHSVFLNGSYAADASKYNDLKTYFPMIEGSTWIYNSMNNIPDDIVTVNDCDKDLNGMAFCIFKESIMDLNVVYTSYAIQGDTVLIRAVQNAMTGNEIKVNSPPEVLLRHPLVAGAIWDTYNDGEKKRQSKILHVISYMKVKAGNYKHVLKIERKWFDKQLNGSWKLSDKDPVVIEYFAPNVGLVRQEVYDARQTKKQVGEKRIYRTQELIEYRHAM